MKKVLLVLPVALLLASCGGGGNNPGPEPSSKELLFGKTFKCPTAVIEKNDEIVSWLDQNKDKIIWYYSGIEGDYAKIQYYSNKLVSNEIYEPNPLNVDNIYEEMYARLKSETVKIFKVFEQVEIDFDENSGGNLRIVDPKKEERPIKQSGSITTTDLEGYEHGEGVKYSGTITDVDGNNAITVSGTFAIKNWEDNKISQTLVSISFNENEIHNDVEFKFPISSNGDDDFTIGGLVNFLPATE